MPSLRILLVEDKELVTGPLVTQLERLGHRVLAVVGDTHAALETAGRLHPDLILLDKDTRPRGAIEAAGAILARHVIPVVMLIGTSNPDIVQRAEEAGILCCVQWPTDADALQSSIDRALLRYRQLQALCAETGNLALALRALPAVHRTSKMLAHRLKLGEAEAFEYLRRQSWSTMTSIEEVAASLLTAEHLLFGKSDLLGCVDTILSVFAPRATVPQRTA